MTDWNQRARELKEMAAELDLWASRQHGRGRMVLGRIADELRKVSGEIVGEDEASQRQGVAPPPDWVIEN